MDFINAKHHCVISGQLEDVHASAANQFLLKESKWFTIDEDEGYKVLQKTFKEKEEKGLTDPDE